LLIWINFGVEIGVESRVKSVETPTWRAVGATGILRRGSV
jgi:hypothetical protein